MAKHPLRIEDPKIAKLFEPEFIDAAHDLNALIDAEIQKAIDEKWYADYAERYAYSTAAPLIPEEEVIYDLKRADMPEAQCVYIAYEAACGVLHDGDFYDIGTAFMKLAPFIERKDTMNPDDFFRFADFFGLEPRLSNAIWQRNLAYINRLAPSDGYINKFQEWVDKQKRA